MGKLFIVPTPIGNLEDITLRCLNVLKEVDQILAEDTRQVSKLLNHYDIQTSKRAYHQHNEHRIAEQIAKELSETEKTIALVSDAGMPGISDPAYLIVKHCINNNVAVECLPGATAFVPALIESGFAATSFVFEGFLPHQKGRSKRLESLKDEKRTMVFYESPYRILKALKQFSDVFGPERNASVSRELTKIYAETIRGTLSELLEIFENKLIKGEFVIIVDGKN
ncbi:MAG: 16S rRNA (cytidine(1402)-2'-O)-methyltransferase [Bacteroidetes bacterium]|nr:16S rRNA (cytidine(1402)-2'-O)-methyltransferase [Bacteroidota bacterium]MBT4970181.1 16S rRNA (cytidine(1402)-2'-O)-methyltransferase [Bacteroidota bacterium]MBT5991145.1 16S rRNA (cytidine(1402)-2'-O)-methyltransferase [Bacteroidota bacterium]MBT6836682.1 16S rRNA (cytidine(1402)-2'-O)-methyltransferase [Bacteroidota bacterium]